MGNLGTDLRYAARTLVKSPGFAAAAILTLALGIGANAAVWSVVHAVLLRPLPYPHPERLVMLWEGDPRRGGASVSRPDFRDFRDFRGQAGQPGPFSGLAVFLPKATQLAGEEGPERLRAGTVTAGFFPILGARPALGRAFVPEDYPAGGTAARHVALLTDGLWRRRFGADPRIVGRTLPLDGGGVTVVGVLPPGFGFSVHGVFRPVDLWLPLALPAGGDRSDHSLRVLGRLRPGISLAVAQAEMEAVAARLARQFPATNAKTGVRLVALQEQIVGATRPALLVLLTAVGLVLLTACANVANLLLARAASRRREIAVRAALGAGRWRLVQQWLAESLLLSTLGGAAGLLLASWGLDLLVRWGGATLPRAEEIGFDAATLGSTAGAVLLSTLFFGLAPAWDIARRSAAPGLQEGSRGTARGGRHRTLAVAEVALALLLATGAGLLLRSFVHLAGAPIGFRPEGVVTAQVILPSFKYREEPAQAAVFAAILDRVSTLPGVRAAGAIDDLPLGGDRDSSSYTLPGNTDLPSAWPLAQARTITPGYLQAMGIPLLAGRAFTAADSRRAPQVAIVDRAFVRRAFPAGGPAGALGRRLSFDGREWRTIVGVAGDVRDLALETSPAPEIYVPHAQVPTSYLTVVLASAPGPSGLARAANAAAVLRQAVRAVDPDLTVGRVAAMPEVIAETLAERRFHLLLLGFFAAAAFGLAAVGVYGVVASGVAERTREIGIRVALGAARGNVLRMVLAQGALLAGAGILLGIAASFASTRLLKGLLYGVGALDPATFAAAAVLLGGVALLASLLPAARAARLDPVVALKGE